MGRPRKDASTPDAKSRMIEAFWTVLKGKPYIHITVGDITRAAEVNKNTLYYHYGCVENLARDAILTSLPIDLAVQLLEGRAMKDIVAQIGVEARTDLARRMALAAGPQGCGILSEMLRMTLVGFWLERHQLELQDLAPEEIMLLRFASSGLVSLFGSSKEVDPKAIALFVSSPFASSTINGVLSALGRAKARKEDCAAADR